MFHLVCSRASVAPFGIAPVMLRDELLETTLNNRLRRQVRRSRQRVPPPTHLPSVLCCQHISTTSNLTPRRHRNIRLLVEPIRHPRNRSSRHKLANEHDAALDTAVVLTTPNIEPKIDLLEPRVPRHNNALHANAIEKERNQRDIALALIKIELQSLRQIRHKLLRRNLILRHDQLPPLRRQEGRGH